jgi:hypothetical protein
MMPSGWDLESGRFIFETQTDLAKFNAQQLDKVIRFGRI